MKSPATRLANVSEHGHIIIKQLTNTVERLRWMVESPTVIESIVTFDN